MPEHGGMVDQLSTAPGRNVEYDKYGVLLACVLLGFVHGALVQLYLPDALSGTAQSSTPLPGIVYGIAATALIFAWYRLDAKQHRYPRSVGLDVAVLLIAIVALPTISSVRAIRSVQWSRVCSQPCFSVCRWRPHSRDRPWWAIGCRVDLRYEVA